MTFSRGSPDFSRLTSTSCELRQHQAQARPREALVVAQEDQGDRLRPRQAVGLAGFGAAAVDEVRAQRQVEAPGDAGGLLCVLALLCPPAAIELGGVGTLAGVGNLDARLLGLLLGELRGLLLGSLHDPFDQVDGEVGVADPGLRVEPVIGAGLELQQAAGRSGGVKIGLCEADGPAAVETIRACRLLALDQRLRPLLVADQIGDRGAAVADLDEGRGIGELHLLDAGQDFAEALDQIAAVDLAALRQLAHAFRDPRQHRGHLLRRCFSPPPPALCRRRSPPGRPRATAGVAGALRRSWRICRFARRAVCGCRASRPRPGAGGPEPSRSGRGRRGSGSRRRRPPARRTRREPPRAPA